jgi:drug/metabolite transporter (DMT)-like permease
VSSFKFGQSKQVSTLFLYCSSVTEGIPAATYSAAAFALLVLVIVTGTNLTGYSRQSWFYIFLLTLLAQILGHTLFNITLRSLSATVVSMGILFEMPGSTIIAAIAIGQIPPWQTLPAITLLMVGMFFVVTGYKTK